MKDERLTVSVSEAAALLGISRAAAYEYVRQGLLPSLLLGRRVLIPYKALRRMVEGEAA